MCTKREHVIDIHGGLGQGRVDKQPRHLRPEAVHPIETRTPFFQKVCSVDVVISHTID